MSITVNNLLTTYHKNPVVATAEKLKFHGVDGYDVYNISAPFQFKGQTYLLGRVEKRDSEFSKACFFEKKAEADYTLAQDAPVFEMQDPFFTWINGQLVVGGVEVSEKADGSGLEWRTVFYEIHSFVDYARFFEGPIGMKDLRIAQLNDGRLLVLTRPQGEKGGRGKIGYAVIETLEELTVELVEQAPLLCNQFTDEEWGGANEIHILNEQCVGVLGHIACFDQEENRHYYAMTFELALDDFSVTKAKIIAERKDFLPGASKRPDLEDVVFSGGLVLMNESAELYAGISDAEAQKLRIENPFK